MSLLAPGPGDYLDRCIILDLKIRVGTEKGVPISHFVDERKGILRILARWQTRKRSRELPWVAWSKRFEALHEVVWKLTDLILQTPEKADRQDLLLPFALNRERAKLISQINNACGVDGGTEKV